MAVTYEIQTGFENSEILDLLNEKIIQGQPTIIFDRGSRIHPSEIIGLHSLPKKQAEYIAFIDPIQDGTKKNRWSSIHILKPETLASDLAFLARILEIWLQPFQEIKSEFELTKHVGKIDENMSILKFLCSLYFDDKPKTAEKVFGGSDGVKDWRRYLRSLGQGLDAMIFEDPWFAYFALIGEKAVIPFDIPLLLLPLYVPQVAQNVAARVFEIVLDKVSTVRTLTGDESEVDIFLVEAEDLQATLKQILNRLLKVHESTPERINLKFWFLGETEKPEQKSDEYCKKLYTLSRLKFGQSEEILMAEWKKQSWPSRMKKIDYFGYLHNLMYRFPDEPFREDGDLLDAFKVLKEEGFLLGYSSPPIELPDEL